MKLQCVHCTHLKVYLIAKSNLDCASPRLKANLTGNSANPTARLTMLTQEICPIAKEKYIFMTNTAQVVIFVCFQRRMFSLCL